MRWTAFVAGTLLLLLLLAEDENAKTPPEVRITSPVGGWTNERVVTVSGTVRGDGVSSVTLLLNGVSQRLRLNRRGFSRKQVLAPGENIITVYAENEAGVGADTLYLFSSAPRKDLRITLTWDTDGTDIDLWVTDPNGEKCFYSHKATKIGGSLDTDVTDGYGPETFTLSRCIKGRYLVQVHYYGGRRPTFCKVEVVRKEGTPQEKRKVHRFLLRSVGEVRTVTEFFVATED